MQLYLSTIGFCYKKDGYDVVLDYSSKPIYNKNIFMREVDLDLLNWFAKFSLYDMFKPRDITDGLSYDKLYIHSYDYNNGVLKFIYKYNDKLHVVSYSMNDIDSISFEHITELYAYIKGFFELSNQAILLKSELGEVDKLYNKYLDNEELSNEIKELFYQNSNKSLLDFALKLDKVYDYSILEQYLDERLHVVHMNSIYAIKMYMIVGLEKFVDNVKTYVYSLNRNTYKYQTFNNILRGAIQHNPLISFYVNLVNKRYKECVPYYFRMDTYFKNEDAFNYAFKNLEDSEVIDVVKELDKNYFCCYSYDLLYNVSNSSFKAILDYLIDNDYIFHVPFKKLYNNDLLDFKYVNRIKYSTDDYKSVIKFLNNLNNPDFHELNYFLTLLYRSNFNSLPTMNKIIKQYKLSDGIFSNIYQRLMNSYYYYDETVRVIELNKIKKTTLDYTELFCRLKPTITANSSEYNYELQVKVYYYNDVVLKFEVNSSTIVVQENKLDNSRQSNVIEAYYNYLLNNNVLGIKDKTNELQVVLNNKLEELRISNIRTLMNNFVEKFDNNALYNIKQELVNLDLYFEYEHDKTIDVKFKLGITKPYVVKSLRELKFRIDTNQNFKYGKDLSFYHSYNAFNSHSQDVLKYLLQGDLYDEYKGIISLNKSVFFKVLSYYKDKYIYLDNKPYLVNLEEQHIKFSVDNDYNFTLDGVGQNVSSIMIDNNKFLLINNNSYEINYVYEDDPTLIPLGVNLNNINIKAVKDEFFNNVYSRIPEYITLDENIKNDFKQSELIIKLYFDYVDDMITVKNEYYINDTLTPYSSVDYVSKQKIDRVHELLNGIGFTDSKIYEPNLIRDFFMMDFSILRKYAEVYLSENISKLNIIQFNKPVVNVKMRENSMVDVFLDEVNYSPEELVEIFKALKKKVKYIKLNDDILTFEDEDFKFYESCNELNLHTDEVVTTPLYNIIKYQFNSKVKFDSYIKQMLYDLKNYKDLDIKLPNINAKLRDYQVDGFKWLKTLEKYNFGGILADEMGLGKTIQIITLLASSNETKPNLIVCPKSLIYNWLNEFKKFAPNMNVITIVGNKDERTKIEENICDNTCYITSYDTVRIDTLDNVSFSYVILDEAQAIKNHNALKSTSIRNLKATHRLCLTGTPIENSIEDIWSIFLFLMPGFFKGLKHFNDEFIDHNNELNLKISPFLLRRTKKEVLKDLPDKYEEIISTEITKEEKKIYEAIRFEAQGFLGTEGALFKILKYLTRLRQCCVSPSLFIDDYNGKSSKLNALFELLVEAKNNNSKVLVFSQFVSSFDLIKTKLNDLNIKFNVITGATSALDRINIANEFNATKNYDLLLISLKAGGTGLNLTSADTVIHLDPWWNVAVENQATDRAHRIGQTKNVRVVKLICEDTIEQRVVMLQNEKKKLFDSVLDNKEEILSKLSEDDIKYILS